MKKRKNKYQKRENYERFTYKVGTPKPRLVGGTDAPIEPPKSQYKYIDTSRPATKVQRERLAVTPPGTQMSMTRATRFI